MCKLVSGICAFSCDFMTGLTIRECQGAFPQSCIRGKVSQGMTQVTVNQHTAVCEEKPGGPCLGGTCWKTEALLGGGLQYYRQVPCLGVEE